MISYFLIGILIMAVYGIFAYARMLENELRICRNQIKEIDKMQQNQNVSLIKLMYHQSIRCEDYEAAKVIKEKMGKDFNFYKMM
jgi:hypothetical protein